MIRFYLYCSLVLSILSLFSCNTFSNFIIASNDEVNITVTNGSKEVLDTNFFGNASSEIVFFGKKKIIFKDSICIEVCYQDDSIEKQNNVFCLKKSFKLKKKKNLIIYCDIIKFGVYTSDSIPVFF